MTGAIAFLRYGEVAAGWFFVLASWLFAPISRAAFQVAYDRLFETCGYALWWSAFTGSDPSPFGFVFFGGFTCWSAWQFIKSWPTQGGM